MAPPSIFAAAADGHRIEPVPAGSPGAMYWPSPDASFRRWNRTISQISACCGTTRTHRISSDSMNSAKSLVSPARSPKLMAVETADGCTASAVTMSKPYGNHHRNACARVAGTHDEMNHPADQSGRDLRQHGFKCWYPVCAGMGPVRRKKET